MADHALRGRPLERAVARAARAYLAAGRCELRKIPTPVVTAGDGEKIRQPAGLDFRGVLAGGRALVLECKEHEGSSLPLDKFPAHQQAEARRLAELGADVRLVVALEDARETFSIPFAGALNAFLLAPWRQSISLDFCRACGELLPDAPRERPDSRSCLFLDGREHPARAAALLAVEGERARARRPPDVDLLGPAPPRPPQPPPPRSAAEARTRVLGAINDHYRSRR